MCIYERPEPQVFGHQLEEVAVMEYKDTNLGNAFASEGQIERL